MLVLSGLSGISGFAGENEGMLYASSVLRVRPDGQAFVCADMYSGVIDFCRLIPGGIERVKLERLSYPMTEISETPVPRVCINERIVLVLWTLR